MGIELRIETPSEPKMVHDSGSDIEVYCFQAYAGSQLVGSLEVNRVRSTTNPGHRQTPLLFDRSGNPQTYQASLQVNTSSYNSNDITGSITQETAREVVDIGAALVKAGQAYCKRTFNTDLVAFDGIETPTERIVWGALLHGYDPSGFVMQTPSSVKSFHISNK